ncbi:hypothetical protein J6590_083545 [Homalodisca vitripennis]|nr:hypothetical protein J6590_083545 [Homalodisca vitripennis]
MNRFLFFQKFSGGTPGPPANLGGFPYPPDHPVSQLVGALTTPVPRPFDVPSTGLVTGTDDKYRQGCA